MSNPIAIAPRADPLEGLAFCGTALVGGAPNYVGGGTDPTVSGTSGLFWYKRPDPAGVLLVDGGPACSHTPLDAIDTIGRHYPYGPIAQNGDITDAGSSTIASDLAAAATCEFVTVQTNFTPGLFDGTPYCADPLPDLSVLTSFAVTMGGAPVDLLDIPSPFPLVPYPHTTFTPQVFQMRTGNLACLLRPTAHTWPGQDPDNEFNRAMWHPSEIGTIAWAMSAYTQSWTVYASYGVYGYQRQTDYPTPCPIIVTGTGPGLVRARPGGGGIRPRGWRPPGLP